MIRGMILTAGPVLVAGVAGLMTAEAQPSRTAKLAEVKRVEQVQKELNATIDALVKLARSRAGAAARANQVSLDINAVVDDSVYRHFFVEKYVVWKQGGLKLDQVVKMQKEINVRFDAMKKAGKLTELDKKILNDGTLSGMHRLIRRR